MEQNKLLSDIRSRISLIQAQIESISSQPEYIYRIDIESVKRNIINLYDLLHELKPTINTASVEQDLPNYLPANTQKSDLVIPEIEDSDIPFETEISSETDAESDYLEEIEAENEEFSPNDVDLELEDDVEFDEQPADVYLEPAPEIKPTLHETKSPNAFVNTLDLFEDPFTYSVSDKHTISDDKSIAARMQQSKIDDLKSAIGINEKFLFINELFGGNLNQYNNAMDELNNFKNIQGAKTYLIELSVAFQWAPNSPVIKKLNDLIDRKFQA